MKKLRIERMRLGQLPTNCYFVMDEETKELLLVDPADQPDRIIHKMKDMGGFLKGILLTHGHYDHIGAVGALKKEYPVPVYAMEDEKAVLSSPDLNLSGMFGTQIAIEADQYLRDGQKLQLLGREVIAVHTPGHTEGGACYYFSGDGVLFSGDTLFCESVGRTDFPTGSMADLIRSIQQKLMVLPEETLVLPGHETETTIGHEKMYNPYL